MLVDLGEEPIHKKGPFNVVAKIYSEKENDYIYTKVLGRFNNYDAAFECWDSTNPSIDVIKKIMTQQRDKGDYSHHELEIGIYSDLDCDLAFLNTTLDPWHERS